MLVLSYKEYAEQSACRDHHDQEDPKDLIGEQAPERNALAFQNWGREPGAAVKKRIEQRKDRPGQEQPRPIFHARQAEKGG